MNPGDLLEIIDHYGDSSTAVLGNIEGDNRERLLVPVGTLCIFIRYTSTAKRKVVILCGNHVGWMWKEEVRRVEGIANTSVVIDSDHTDVSIGSLVENQQS
jgi:hypothetical protein